MKFQQLHYFQRKFFSQRYYFDANSRCFYAQSDVFVLQCYVIKIFISNERNRISGRYINIGLMQNRNITSEFETSLARIHNDVDDFMAGINTSELIVGVGMVIGRFFKGDS